MGDRTEAEYRKGFRVKNKSQLKIEDGGMGGHGAAAPLRMKPFNLQNAEVSLLSIHGQQS